MVKGGDTVAKGKYQEWLTKEGLLRLQGWARDGLSDEQIAANMGISIATLYNWKRDHLEILEALKEGKDAVDRQVENALLKSALGYKYDEVTKELRDDELVVTKVVHKEVQPNTTAQIFWLKNRKRAEWRDRVENALTGADGGAVKVEMLTDADVDARIKELESKLKELDK
ncbi:helix-turn-helix domain-containing protein [Megasphaera elsdenii]|uniref:helix-turn-helix domain-containing protein n=1 Tax=Megasphaera elsdenii TaxID=907 RepID=UPI0035C6C68B